MDERNKENHLIKARKFCNIFWFIDNLNSINDGGELEINCCIIYPEELETGKENADRHEARGFQVSLFDKWNSCPFGIVRLPDILINVLLNIVYSAVATEYLKIPEESSNPDSFSTAVFVKLNKNC